MTDYEDRSSSDLVTELEGLRAYRKALWNAPHPRDGKTIAECRRRIHEIQVTLELRGVPTKRTKQS